MAKLMLFAAMLLAISATDVLANPAVADHTLLKYMMKNTFSVDPTKSALCFGYFIPILNGFADTFSKNYQQCTIDEQNKVTSINAEADTFKYQLELAADNICVRLEACSTKPTPLEFFDCYGGQSKIDTRVLYEISENSTEIASNLREEFRLAELNRFRCQNVSERSYVSGTASTYKQLDLCLQTGDVPTVSPVTTTTEIVTTTTTTTVEDTTANVKMQQQAEETPMLLAQVQQQQPMLPIERGSSIMSKLQSFWRN